MKREDVIKKYKGYISNLTHNAEQHTGQRLKDCLTQLSIYREALRDMEGIDESPATMQPLKTKEMNNITGLAAGEALGFTGPLLLTSLDGYNTAITQMAPTYSKDDIERKAKRVAVEQWSKTPTLDLELFKSVFIPAYILAASQFPTGYSREQMEESYRAGIRIRGYEWPNMTEEDLAQKHFPNYLNSLTSK